MSRPRWQLRDAALGYASRGIPVLPLHYPLPHRTDLQPVTGDPQPAVGCGCSCRDPGCGQAGKHPLGTLVPHGVKDATCNRARVLAWWTRHPQANIGLATGHAFDVLDIDGPEGHEAIRELAATHGLHSAGPLVRTGGGGWHYYVRSTGLGNICPAGLDHVDWRGRGGYVIAPPSRHASGHTYQWVVGRDLDTPLVEIPAPLRARLERRSPQRSPHSMELAATGAALGDRYARAALAEELARVATAPSATATGSCGSPPATSTTWWPPGLSTTATSITACSRRPSAVASSRRSPARPTGPWLRAARSAWPTPAAHASPPAPNAPTPRRSRLPERSASGPRRGGDGHGWRRPPGRLKVSRGGRVPPPSRARAHPNHPQEGACMGSHPTLAHHELAAEALELDPDDWQHGHAIAHLATEHPQVRAWPDDNPDLAHHLDHRDWTYDHTHHPSRERAAEEAFDRLNPTFGVPADRSHPIGHRDVQQREAALALGIRVAVHDSRQNDPNPVIWQPGQDYRAADAIHAARHQATRARWGPERVGSER